MKFRNYYPIFIIILLAGCNDQASVTCTAPDDWGNFRNVTVDSNRPKGSDDFRDDALNNSENDHGNQVIKFQDTNLETDGRPIRAIISGGWCPFSGCSAATFSPIDMNDCSKQVPQVDANGIELYPALDKMPVKNVTNANGITLSCPFADSAIDPYNGRGKFFTNGVGLYLLFRRQGEPVPNGSLTLMRNPTSPTVHVGRGVTDGVYKSENKLPMDNLGVELPLQPGWRVYAKILDTYYPDNKGAYNITFTSGIRNAGAASPFEWLRSSVEDFLLDAAQTQYTALTSKSSYAALVYGLLAIYIACTSIAYLIGMVQISQGDLFMRILKVSIVAALVGPNSWDFFNSHLFEIFFNLPKWIIPVTAVGYYDPTAPFGFLDRIIFEQLWSKPTWNKIEGVFHTGGMLGIVYILIILGIFIYATFIATRSVVIYLTCMMVLSYIVVMFPIICAIGLLFPKFSGDILKSWFTMMISWTAQAIFSMYTVCFFLTVLFTHFYKTIGYLSCQGVSVFLVSFGLAKIGADNQDSFTIMKVKGSVPGIEKYYRFVSLLSLDTMAMNLKRYYFCGTRAVIDVPPDYKTRDYRYIEMPYLDPDITSTDPVVVAPVSPSTTTTASNTPPPPKAQSSSPPKDRPPLSMDPWEDNITVTTQSEHKALHNIMHEEDGTASFLSLQMIGFLILFTLIMAQIMDSAAYIGQFLATGSRSFSSTAADAFRGLSGDITSAMNSNPATKMVYDMTFGQLGNLRMKIGQGIDYAEYGIDKAAGFAPFSGSFIDKGVNAQAQEIIDHNRKVRLIHMYQDLVGGTAEYAGDRAAAAGKTLAVEGVKEMVAPGYAFRKVDKAVIQGLLKDQSAQDIAGDIRSGMGKAVNSRAELTDGNNMLDDSYKSYMSRVMGRYFPGDRNLDSDIDATAPRGTPINSGRDNTTQQPGLNNPGGPRDDGGGNEPFSPQVSYGKGLSEDEIYGNIPFDDISSRGVPTVAEDAFGVTQPDNIPFDDISSRGVPTVAEDAFGVTQPDNIPFDDISSRSVPTVAEDAFGVTQPDNIPFDDISSRSVPTVAEGAFGVTQPDDFSSPESSTFYSQGAPSSAYKYEELAPSSRQKTAPTMQYLSRDKDAAGATNITEAMQPSTPDQTTPSSTPSTPPTIDTSQDPTSGGN